MIKIESLKNYIGVLDESDFDLLAESIYEITDFICEDYPKHREWYFEKQIPRVFTPSGEILFARSDDGSNEIIAMACLKKDEEEIELAIEKKQVKSDKQIRALRFLMENEGVLVTDLEVFADVSRSVINTLEKNGYIEIIEKQVERNPFMHKVIQADQDFVLTPEQNQAYQTICDSMEDYLFSEFLLFGVTGSRKNRGVFASNRKGIKRGEV